MTRIRMLVLVAMTALPLAACGSTVDGNQTVAAADEGATTPTSTAGVTRQEVAPPQPTVQPMEQATALQSQPGPDGSQVDLIRLAVTGDILTATFRCSSADRINTESFDISKVSMIDDATSQRIAVLKDNAGNWLASEPTGRAMVSCEQKPGVFWVKFPAPPVTSATVSLNLPQTGPFDGVPVTR